MKVLHLISGGDSGGAKTHVFSLLGELKNHIDVKIICLIPGIFYQEILDKSIPVELFEQKHRYDLSVVKKIAALIVEEKYELVHAHGARANFIASILKRHIRVPMVTTVHSDYLLDFDGGFYRRLVYTGLNMLSLKYMDYYIAVSESFREMLVSRGYLPDKIFTVYNGIDFDAEVSACSREQFLMANGINSKENEVLIGIIGRLDKVKGHEVFIKAAAEVVAKVPNTRFLLAGDGSEKEGLMQLAKQLGVQDKVIFLGFIDRIYDFINAIDINTLTSYSESFPYVLLEGARLHKPTVSSAVGGIPDLIKDGQNGYLFKSADYLEMAQKLLMLVEDSTLRKELGQKLYERAKESFSNKSLARRHIEIYGQILRRHDS
ncbi:MAG: glycosyltransferase family 4 protein [Clostridia bacterium]